jgi:hypothetical protein
MSRSSIAIRPFLVPVTSEGSYSGRRRRASTCRGRIKPKWRRSRVELGLVQALHDGHDRCIDEADVGIRVPVAELPNPPIVLRLEVLDNVGAVEDVIKKCGEHTRVEPLANPVVHFHDDRRWDDERFRGFLDQLPTCPMAVIPTIQRRVEQTGI